MNKQPDEPVNAVDAGSVEEQTEISDNDILRAFQGDYDPDKPVYDLVTPEDEKLISKSEQFDFQTPPMDPKELAETLVNTMFKHNGLGLAANQVGLLYRVFALRTDPPLVVFNPRIVDASEDQIYLDEGCVSFPNLFVKIKRPKSIRARFEVFTGETFTEKYTGMTARCFQHEFDHSEGILFTSRANNYHLQIAKKNRKILLRRIKARENENRR
jgi:peptide deformylase